MDGNFLRHYRHVGFQFQSRFQVNLLLCRDLGWLKEWVTPGKGENGRSSATVGAVPSRID